MDILLLTQTCREVQFRRTAPFPLSGQVDHFRHSSITRQGGSQQHCAEVDDAHDAHNDIENPNTSRSPDFGEHKRVDGRAWAILVALSLHDSIGNPSRPKP